MTQVDIEKLILENGFKLEDKQGNITYEFGTGDIYRISQLLFKKMNYIPCSEQLKVVEKMNFEDWVESQGYVKTKGKDEYRKGMIRTDDFNLKHTYTKYINL